ncbi:MAG: hypothetical protein Q8L60_10430 [Gammaproteobacteria bacterium]|nr:hypothetical protein [Gammaproteobacteria bacterium]MDP2346765.1 hypothetical protein [Gammaproteobacteria bacterium]
MSREAAKEAAKVLSKLYVLGAITDILEGGSGNSIECGQRIIKICEKERVKLVRKYDALIAGIDQ